YSATIATACRWVPPYRSSGPAHKPQASGHTRDEARVMITARVRKTGNSYVVTIPREEMERLNIADGDLVGLEIRRATVSYELPPELDAAFKHSWEAHRETYRYLAEH